MLLLTMPYRGHFICFLLRCIMWLRNLAKHFGQELLGFGRQNLITKWIRKFFSYLFSYPTSPQKKFGIHHEKKLDYNTRDFCCIHNTCMGTQICKVKVNFACGKYNQAHLLAIYFLCHWLPSVKEETFALIICLHFWAFGMFLPLDICHARFAYFGG